MKLHHIAISVNNLEESVKFYTEVLGFGIALERPGMGTFLTCGKIHHDLALFQAAPDAAPLPGKLLAGTLAFGAIRQSLLPLTGRNSAFLASHDPDGHLFAVSFSHPKAHKTGSCGN